MDGPVSDIRIVENTIFHSNRGIFIEGVTGSQIAENTLLHNLYGGIELSAGSTGNKITSNTSLGNGCDLWHDDSSSPNVWVDNLCRSTCGADASCRFMPGTTP